MSKAQTREQKKARTGKDQWYMTIGAFTALAPAPQKVLLGAELRSGFEADAGGCLRKHTTASKHACLGVLVLVERRHRQRPNIISWPMKLRLGDAQERWARTISKASECVWWPAHMRYAVAMADEREIPARQCTRILPPQALAESVCNVNKRDGKKLLQIFFLREKIREKKLTYEWSRWLQECVQEYLVLENPAT